MTLWEWAIAATVLGPVLAVIALWFLEREQGQSVGAAFLSISGIAGIVACGYGVVATEPFLLPTGLFFGMTASLDKFSAMFLLPFMIVLAAIGIQWFADRASAPLTMARALGTALLTVGVTWVVLATNILGVIAALAVLTCGATCLSFKSVRLIVLRSIGTMAIAAGLFILSAGALFNDFGTLAYIAAELDAARLAGAFAAIVLGTVFLMGAWPLTRMTSVHTALTPTRAERALMHSAFFLVPMYLFIRVLLFVLPPLSMWFAVSVSVIGMFTVFAITQYAAKRRAFSQTFFISAAGIALFMLSGAMMFQSLALYDGMNVALFATIVYIIGAVLAGSLQEFFPQRNTAELAAGVVASSAVPPSVIFVGVWMFAGSIIGSINALPASLALWFAVGLMVVFSALVRRGIAAAQHVRLVSALVPQATAEPRNVAYLALVGISTLGAFGIPYALFAIGAGPLTLGGETWQGAVLSADGALRLLPLMLGVFILSGAAWLLRDKTLSIAPEEASHPSEHSEQHAESRFTMLRRETHKVFTQHVVVPGIDRLRAFRTWYETQSARHASAAIALMLLTVILTLALAL